MNSMIISTLLVVALSGLVFGQQGQGGQQGLSLGSLIPQLGGQSGQGGSPFMQGQSNNGGGNMMSSLMDSVHQMGQRLSQTIPNMLQSIMRGNTSGQIGQNGMNQLSQGIQDSVNDMMKNFNNRANNGAQGPTRLFQQGQQGLSQFRSQNNDAVSYLNGQNSENLFQRGQRASNELRSSLNDATSNTNSDNTNSQIPQSILERSRQAWNLMRGQSNQVRNNNPVESNVV